MKVLWQLQNPCGTHCQWCHNDSVCMSSYSHFKPYFNAQLHWPLPQMRDLEQLPQCIPTMVWQWCHNFRGTVLDWTVELLFGVSHLRQRLTQLQYSVTNIINNSDIQSLSFVVKFDLIVICEDTCSHIRVWQSLASFIYGILDMVRALAAKAISLGLIPGGCLDCFLFQQASFLMYRDGELLSVVL